MVLGMKAEPKSLKYAFVVCTCAKSLTFLFSLKKILETTCHQIRPPTTIENISSFVSGFSSYVAQSFPTDGSNSDIFRYDEENAHQIVYAKFVRLDWDQVNDHDVRDEQRYFGEIEFPKGFFSQVYQDLVAFGLFSWISDLEFKRYGQHSRGCFGQGRNGVYFWDGGIPNLSG
jgi:hypothetical protein